MRFNHFNSMILGIQINGQGIVNAVEATHRTTLRTLITKFAPSFLARQLAFAIAYASRVTRLWRDDARHGDVSELFGHALPAPPALDVGRRSRPRHSRRLLIRRVLADATNSANNIRRRLSQPTGR